MLQHQHMSMPIAYDILVSLNEMFGGKGRPTKQVALKAIMNTKMSKGTLIKDDMIRMIGLFNKMKILKAKIDRETQVHLVLKTLLHTFKLFKINYSMNTMVMSLTKLMRELQTTKGILKDQRRIHKVVNGSSSSFSNKKNNTTKFTKQKGKFKSKGRKKKKSKCHCKCFLCSKKGYQKKECLKFLKRESSMSYSFLVESCLVLDSTNSWWIYFEFTDHVYNSL